MTDLVTRIAKALKGHRYDSMSQDSGQQCEGCKSDSRFQRGPDDPPWKNIDEHRAQVVYVVIEQYIREQNSLAWEAGHVGCRCKRMTDKMDPCENPWGKA